MSRIPNTKILSQRLMFKGSAWSSNKLFKGPQTRDKKWFSKIRCSMLYRIIMALVGIFSTLHLNGFPLWKPTKQWHQQLTYILMESLCMCTKTSGNNLSVHCMDKVSHFGVNMTTVWQTSNHNNHAKWVVDYSLVFHVRKYYSHSSIYQYLHECPTLR